ncbi:disintegrin and metalloproteinase domain-containing protein 5-like isoform X2 [Tupaia chinensis]|nr:disintegrin and metalloproteinase domain-containing protein 5-like isoform X2 [Tupaia chinensis]
MQFNNISYGIEPVEAVSGFVHMIYEEKIDYTHISLLEKDAYAWFNSSRFQVRTNLDRTGLTKLYPRSLKMYIIVDNDLFNYMGSDIKAVTEKVIHIIGLMNTMLTPLKLTVIISSIEIWSNKNKISASENPDLLLFRFLEWKRKHLDHRPHHVTYLFTFRNHSTFIGTTVPEKICEKNYAAGVALYLRGLSLESYAVIIVQLLGLNLGLSYDDPDNCYCSGDVCTMTPKALYSSGVKDFSTCSLEDFKYFASNGDFGCLQNTPIDVPAYRQAPKKICGNGQLEAGEQCDCGTLENCTHKACCDPTSCLFKGDVQCGSGECCEQNCKFKPINTLCRKSMDEDCDFPEYCNATLPHCGPNTFARNGQSCMSGEAFCYDGTCRTFDKQCKALVGGGSRGAPFSCYDEMNSRLDRFGNCGRNICQFPNMLCGKLICTWPHRNLIKRTNLSVVYAHILNEVCVSTFRPSQKPPKPNTDPPLTTYNSADDRDETFVEDGTICGPEMYCYKFACLEIKYRINYTLCESSSDCNMHGVCNNFNHCQCEKGYSPPDCHELKGEFGSIDDGHVIKEAARSFSEGRRGTFHKQKYQMIFYISLPVIIIITAVLLKKNKLRELCDRGETESERSVSEESSQSKSTTSSAEDRTTTVS